jgi:hypothetical protein
MNEGERLITLERNQKSYLRRFSTLHLEMVQQKVLILQLMEQSSTTELIAVHPVKRFCFCAK